MVKKGQGALEFLMTYGWAFLVILIMIGALAYFGVLNPQRFLPDRCMFTSQFNCENPVIRNEGDGTATILLEFRNNLGEDLYFNLTDIETDFTEFDDKNPGTGLTGGWTVYALNTANPPDLGTGQVLACFDQNDDGVCGATALDEDQDVAADGGVDANSLNDGAPDQDTMLKAGETKYMVIHFSDEDASRLPEGSKVKFDVTLKYWSTDSNAALGKKITGEVYTTVE